MSYVHYLDTLSSSLQAMDCMCNPQHKIAVKFHAFGEISMHELRFVFCVNKTEIPCKGDSLSMLSLLFTYMHGAAYQCRPSAWSSSPGPKSLASHYSHFPCHSHDLQQFWENIVYKSLTANIKPVWWFNLCEKGDYKHYSGLPLIRPPLEPSKCPDSRSGLISRGNL